jgi:hypothetical protein
MTFNLYVPADVRSYSEKYFILGTEDAEAMELDVDDVVAKDFDDVTRDARRYHGKDFFNPAGFRRARPSDVDPELSLVDFDGGTLLLDDQGTPIGGYVESDLVLEYEWRERGLGTEIVVEHFLSNGCFPTWWLDSAQYSEAGYSTHLSAHAYPSTKPVLYLRKLARHVLIDNPVAFAAIVEAEGETSVETELARAIAATGEESMSERVETFIRARQWALTGR